MRSYKYCANDEDALTARIVLYSYRQINERQLFCCIPLTNGLFLFPCFSVWRCLYDVNYLLFHSYVKKCLTDCSKKHRRILKIANIFWLMLKEGLFMNYLDLRLEVLLNHYQMMFVKFKKIFRLIYKNISRGTLDWCLWFTFISNAPCYWIIECILLIIKLLRFY